MLVTYMKCTSFLNCFFVIFIVLLLIVVFRFGAYILAWIGRNSKRWFSPNLFQLVVLPMWLCLSLRHKDHQKVAVQLEI